MNPLLWLLHFITRFLTVREIRCEDGTLYLSRYRLLGWMPGDKRKWPLCIYLHRFHRPDLDDAPHNHPWKWSFSFVLSGGYIEFRANGDPETPHFIGWTHRIKPFRFNWIPHSCYHVVKELRGKETWTLFVTGPKTGSWGFWVFGRGHVEWRDRLRERGILVPDATHEEV